MSTVPGLVEPPDVAAWSATRTLAATCVLLAGYVVGLVTLPYRFPVPSDVASAAAVAGYHNGVAYRFVLGWSIAGVLALALIGRGARARVEDPPRWPQDLSGVTGRRWRVFELVAVFAVFIGLYCPVFLAKSGPITEDAVMLNVLYRMQHGHVPYRDFEFLYGPLMIYPAHAWMRVFGYSLHSYYGYLALLEAGLFTLLVGVLQTLLPDWRRRWLVFLLLLPFLFDTLLGVNWNGLRRLVPLLILLLVVGGPDAMRRVMAAGALAGLQLAYSHDYGVATLGGVCGLYAFLGLRRDGANHLTHALTFLALAGATWLIVASLLLGPALPEYVRSVVYLVGRYNRGEAAFRFYWTANALALFLLLALSCTVVGAAALRERSNPSAPGDRMLVAALCYVLVALRSGLNRADFWHLDAAFLPLAAAWLLRPRLALLRVVRPVRVVAAAAVLVASATCAYGSVPSGRWYAQAYYSGLRDVLSGRRPANVAIGPLRGPALELERTDRRRSRLVLGAWLAEPSRAAQPVVFYGSSWGVGKQIGVCKADYLNDDFLYSEERGLSVRRLLEDRPDAFVVIARPVYERLTAPAGADATEFGSYAETQKDAPISWLTSVHHRELPVELRVKEARWRRTVGEFVVANYAVAAEFGDLIVLARAGPGG